MSLSQPSMCPNCRSSNYSEISSSSGTSYVLTTVDQNEDPPSFNPTSGLPVNVIGCVDCGVATLHIPSLKRQ